MSSCCVHYVPQNVYDALYKTFCCHPKLFINCITLCLQLSNKAAIKNTFFRLAYPIISFSLMWSCLTPVLTLQPGNAIIGHGCSERFPRSLGCKREFGVKVIDTHRCERAALALLQSSVAKLLSEPLEPLSPCGQVDLCLTTRLTAVVYSTSE